ncbi:MAG: hypothetical protein IT484_04445 [Gammaproteobacteria bacterium]|nr:hypothetical protein [Gammaproteobacteria bacterium]
MQTRITVCAGSPPGTVLAPAGCLPGLLLLAAGALADQPPAATAHDFDPDAAVSQVVAPLVAGGTGLAAAVAVDLDAPDDSAAAPAVELATGLNVQMDLNRRKFRTRAIDWVMDRSVTVGYLADFLVGGADSGWHLGVDLRGDDEYTLQWRARFR